MLIALWIQAIIAVLGFAAVFSQNTYSSEFFNNTLYESRVRRSPHHTTRRPRDSWQDSYPYDQNRSLLSEGAHLTLRESQLLLRNETRNGIGADCCPSVLEMIEPTAGRNMDDVYVDLYRNGDYKQRFYELSCHRGVLDRPCRFLERKLHDQSRCVQKYSYTYALVKDPGRHHRQRPKFPSFPAPGHGGDSWTLDYIRVRSGCTCVVTPAKRKRDRHKNGKKHHVTR